MSSSDSDLKEDRVLLLLLCLVSETGADDSSANLTFITLSLKMFKGFWLKQWYCCDQEKMMVEDLCRIFLKVFHRALGPPLFSAMTVE